MSLDPYDRMPSLLERMAPVEYTLDTDEFRRRGVERRAARARRARRRALLVDIALMLAAALVVFAAVVMAWPPA